MSLPCGHIGATWGIRLNLCFLRPTRVHNPNSNRSVQPFFCTAHGRVSSGMPGYVLSPNNCPSAWRSGPHLIHASLGPPESISQTASRSVQPFLYSSRQSVVGNVMTCPSLAPSHGGSVPHLIRGSLRPLNSASQTASRLVQPFLHR